MVHSGVFLYYWATAGPRPKRRGARGSLPPYPTLSTGLGLYTYAEFTSLLPLGRDHDQIKNFLGTSHWTPFVGAHPNPAPLTECVRPHFTPFEIYMLHKSFHALFLLYERTPEFDLDLDI